MCNIGGREIPFMPMQEGFVEGINNVVVPSAASTTVRFGCADSDPAAVA